MHRALLCYNVALPMTMYCTLSRFDTILACEVVTERQIDVGYTQPDRHRPTVGPILYDMPRSHCVDDRAVKMSKSTAVVNSAIIGVNKLPEWANG